MNIKMDQDEAMFGIGVGTTDSMYTVDLSNAPKTKPKTNWTKIGAITLGALVGLSHIGMIGMISRKSEFPVVNVPVGPYTSYMVEADKEGYRISYKANDPKVMRVERDLKEKGGFLGLANENTRTYEEYTMDGSKHLQYQKLGDDISASGKSEACIEAIGSGKGTGRMVGASVGAAVAPAFTNIPFVGWVIAGAATMMGMDQGAEIGGNMVEDLNKNC